MLRDGNFSAPGAKFLPYLADNLPNDIQTGGSARTP